MAHNPGASSVMAGNSRQQEPEAAGHIVASTRKQTWMLAYTTALRPLSLPMQLRISSPPTVKKSLPILINVTKIIPSRHAQRPISKVILGSVPLVAHSCHHAPPPQDHQGSSSAPGEGDVLSIV